MNRVLRHRLRNMASGIRSATTLLSQELAERLAPEEREFFPLILGECDRLNEITTRMNLLFDELPGGTPRAIDPVLRDALDALHGLMPTAEVSMDVDRSAAGVMVREDRLVLVAVREVLVNAAEAAPGEPISLRCEGRCRALTLIVTDRGAGVPAGDLENIFRPFFTTRERHLGVGLTIARRAMRQAGGDVRAFATRDGGLGMELSLRPAA